VQETTIAGKYDRLQAILTEMQSVLIAYSGGVDSTLLLKAAVEALGPEKVVAATALSPSYPDSEQQEARKIASGLGVRHREFSTDELDDPHFAQNPPTRCYFCKRELMSKLRRIAEEEGMAAVAEASNADDVRSDYRPGLRAVRELGVRSPLVEAGLGKAEIREISRRLGLPTWDKPSFACLASRFPYGEQITRDKLERVEAAENVLRQMGFRQFRVRSHGAIARIELGVTEDWSGLLDGGRARELVGRLKELGFTYVTLDLEGYRTGSMNEVLSGEERKGA